MSLFGNYAPPRPVTVPVSSSVNSEVDWKPLGGLAEEFRRLKQQNEALRDAVITFIDAGKDSPVIHGYPDAVEKGKAALQLQAAPSAASTADYWRGLYCELTEQHNAALAREKALAKRATLIVEALQATALFLADAGEQVANSITHAKIIGLMP